MMVSRFWTRTSEQSRTDRPRARASKFRRDGNDDLVQMRFTWGWVGQGGTTAHSKTPVAVTVSRVRARSRNRAFPRQIKLHAVAA